MKLKSLALIRLLALWVATMATSTPKIYIKVKLNESLCLLKLQCDNIWSKMTICVTFWTLFTKLLYPQPQQHSLECVQDRLEHMLVRNIKCTGPNLQCFQQWNGRMHDLYCYWKCLSLLYIMRQEPCASDCMGRHEASFI